MVGVRIRTYGVSVFIYGMQSSVSVYVFLYMFFVPISFRQINLKKISPAAQIPYLLFYAKKKPQNFSPAAPNFLPPASKDYYFRQKSPATVPRPVSVLQYEFFSAEPEIRGFSPLQVALEKNRLLILPIVYFLLQVVYSRVYSPCGFIRGTQIVPTSRDQNFQFFFFLKCLLNSPGSLSVTDWQRPPFSPFAGLIANLSLDTDFQAIAIKLGRWQKNRGFCILRLTSLYPKKKLKQKYVPQQRFNSRGTRGNFWNSLSASVAQKNAC